MYQVIVIEIPNSFLFNFAIRLVLIDTWLILGLRPANERRRYFVTTSLTGWAQA